MREALSELEGIAVTSSMPNNLRFQRRGLPWNAILLLARYLGLSPARPWPSGMGKNDLSMMELAGIGVAMDNGNPRLRRSADFTADQ